MLQTIAWVMVVGGVVWFLIGVLVTPRDYKQDGLNSQ